MDSDPRTPGGARPRIDARTTAWLIAQRERTRALELEKARLEGELAASARIERAAQRYADKLEEKLTEGRKREASLARALGYVEAQRDQLQARLPSRTASTPPALEAELFPRPAPRPGAGVRPVQSGLRPGPSPRA